MFDIAKDNQIEIHEMLSRYYCNIDIYRTFYLDGEVTIYHALQHSCFRIERDFKYQTNMEDVICLI